MKKVVVLINALSEKSTEDELDVLEQACLIEDTLEKLGYESSRVFMDLNVEAAARQIQDIGPDFVVNLVEGLVQDARLIHWAPALLEHLGLPFTGCTSESIFVTGNKILTKKLMMAHGIPTPQLITNPAGTDFHPGKIYMAKPVWEDASVGISDENVMPGERNRVDDFLAAHGDTDWFFEEFVSGREFNIAVLGGVSGPEVLPMAEIVFDNFPEGKPQIVGYEAKWNQDSFEYKNTNRRFGIETENPELAERMKQICLRCWQVFGLKGYIRVDLRVNQHQEPMVLEINANPCLSPDAGFVAAANQAGYPFEIVLQRMIEDAFSSK